MTTKLGSTLTIRNVPSRVVRSLKTLAKRRGQSMEQVVRDVLEEHAVERESVLRQIEALRSRQTRRATTAEIEAWIGLGRD
jgi:plasmid stability protein